MNVILFDIDGTLLVTNRAGSTAMHAALREEFGIDTPAAVDFAGRTDSGIIAEFFARHALEHNEAMVARFIAAYLRQLPVALARQGGSVLPGVLAMLDQLAARTDCAVGLLTGNLQAGAIHKLTHFQLVERFAFGGFGDRHANRNEVARDALAAAVHHLGKPVSEDRVLVIGDTLRDIECARAIGAKAIAVATGSHRYEQLAAAQPDVLLRDLTMLEFLWDLLDR